MEQQRRQAAGDQEREQAEFGNGEDVAHCRAAGYPAVVHGGEK